MEKIVIYTDGASRGNPGPAGIGIAFCNTKGETLKEYSKEIGKATNNEAEYQAVIFALKKAKALFGKKKIKKYKIEIRADSELLVSQLNGEYKIKEPRIQDLFIKVWNLKVEIGDIVFISIPREENKLADKLANEAVDGGNVNKRLF